MKKGRKKGRKGSSTQTEVKNKDGLDPPIRR